MPLDMVVFFLSLFVVVVLNFIIVNEMTYRYPNTYESIGKPGRLFLNLGQLHFFYAFILFGKYKEHDLSRGMRQACGALRLALFVFHAAFLYGFIADHLI